mgnify:CR=1 FL=1
MLSHPLSGPPCLARSRRCGVKAPQRYHGCGVVFLIIQHRGQNPAKWRHFAGFGVAPLRFLGVCTRLTIGTLISGVELWSLHDQVC